MLGQGLHMTPEEFSLESECVSELSTRRRFLQKAVGLAAVASVFSPDPQASAAVPDSPLLPTVKLGKYEVTRLILGGNPIYGYSHFNHLLSRYQTDWHTPERVAELVRHAEAQGINTWQNSYAE